MNNDNNYLKDSISKSLRNVIVSLISLSMLYVFIKYFFAELYKAIVNIWGHAVWVIGIIILIYLLFKLSKWFPTYLKIRKVRLAEKAYASSPIGTAESKIRAKLKGMTITEGKLVRRKKEILHKTKIKEQHIKDIDNDLSTKMFEERDLQKLKETIADDKKTIHLWNGHLKLLEEKHISISKKANALHTFLKVLKHQNKIGNAEKIITEIDILLREIHFLLKHEYSDSWEYDTEIMLNAKCSSELSLEELKQKLSE